MPDDDTAAEPAPSAEILATLVASHRELLAFVERRVGDRDTAEEILQSALVRSLDKLDAVRETAIGWFYRVLRNAIIDHHRRRAAAARGLERYAADPAAAPAADAPASELHDPAPHDPAPHDPALHDPALHGAVCRCVSALADTLKPEYAAALRRVELDGVPVKDYAAELGISSSNAGVRVFRAREALRRQVVRTCGTCATHGCLDCTCGAPHGAGAPRDRPPHAPR